MPEKLFEITLSVIAQKICFLNNLEGKDIHMLWEFNYYCFKKGSLGISFLTVFLQ